MSLKNFLCTVVIGASGLTLYAQPGARPAGTTTYGKYEINLFGGGNFYHRQDPRPFLDLGNGGIFGGRLTQNYWNYIGIEETVGIQGTQNACFTQANSVTNVSCFGARLRYFSINPVFHFAGRESRVRPFLTVGGGANWHVPTDRARNFSLRTDGGGLGQPTNLKTNVVPAFNYGAGLKAKFNERIAGRIDARGVMSQGIDLGLPGNSAPATVVRFVENHKLNAFQLTGGLTFLVGTLTEEPIGDWRAGNIEASTQSACPGDPLTFRVPVTNSILGVTTKYTWTIDGRDGGSTSESLTIKAPDSGPVTVKATAAPDVSTVTEKRITRYLRKFPLTAAERTSTVTIKPYARPTLNLRADPSTISSTQTSTLTADGTGSECSGALTYDWTATVGRLTGTGNTRTFSPDGLGLIAGGPSRTAEITAKITDTKGGNASATTSVTVTAPPAPPVVPPKPIVLQAQQFDDILFGRGAIRVNNCGKRALDRAFDQAMASNDYDILLVGHIQTGEERFAPRVRGSRERVVLDRQRVLEAAAYLSGGTQPCKNIPVDRIKVAMAGDAQSSPLKTALCEASVGERAGSKINPRDDNAKFRRVEVWLVPREGRGPMPSGISGVMPAPAAEVRALGCPK